MKKSHAIIFLLVCTIGFLYGCADHPIYDQAKLAKIAYEEKGEEPIIFSKCGYIKARLNEKSGDIEEGLCVLYDKAFIYRSVSSNNPMSGNSTFFYFENLKGVSLSYKGWWGLKQLMITSGEYVHAFIFRPPLGIGFDNQIAEDFWKVLQQKGVKEVSPSEPLDVIPSSTTTWIYIPKK